MKIQIIKVVKPAYQEYSRLVEQFVKRIKPWNQIESIVLKDDRSFQKWLQSVNDQPGSFLVCCDEAGESFTSEALAGFLDQKRMDPGVDCLCFLIGPPYGFDSELRKRAQKNWQLSAGIFSSDLAWLVCVEQIYRSLSILHGSPYHHGARVDE